VRPRDIHWEYKRQQYTVYSSCWNIAPVPQVKTIFVTEIVTEAPPIITEFVSITVTSAEPAATTIEETFSLERVVSYTLPATSVVASEYFQLSIATGPVTTETITKSVPSAISGAMKIQPIISLLFCCIMIPLVNIFAYEIF